jgi:Methyltransferase domain
LLNEWSFQQLIDALQHLVEHLENEPSLIEPNQLRQRLEALDRLDAHFPDAYFPDTLSPVVGVEGGLYQRARAIRARLEAVNCELYEAIRCEIRRGSRPDTLLRWIHSSPEIGASSGMGYDYGYDYMDELISGVFQFEEPDDGQVRRKSDMVFYQPTPARHIFDMIGLAALTATDVLVDIGSGLGHVSLLVSICTSASSIGIELEASYVERARQCAQRLNLNRVAFIQQDARIADLSNGTVFYLYTPFAGSILRCVLNLLRREAATRRIRICTYGPCTSVIAEEPWLEASAAPKTDRIAVFCSKELRCDYEGWEGLQESIEVAS